MFLHRFLERSDVYLTFFINKMFLHRFFERKRGKFNVFH